MEIKNLMKVKEMLCKEIDKIAEKGEMNMPTLDNLYKLTDVVKNIDKIVMLEEEQGDEGEYSERRYSRRGYSRGGDWEARGSYGHGSAYDDGGSSYAGRGQHYVRGHYSRDAGGYSQGGGYSRGGYSRDGGRDSMMRKFEEMMQSASGQDREIIQRAMDDMRRA